MALNARFEIIVSKHIGVQKAKELSDAIQAAYEAGGSGTLSGRGEQLLGNLLGNAAGRDFKASADAAGNPYTEHCGVLLSRAIGEMDANEVIQLFTDTYEAPSLSLPESFDSDGNPVSVSIFIVSGDSSLPLQVTIGGFGFGTYTLATTEGITFNDGANGTDLLQIRGTAAALNAAMDGATFDPNGGSGTAEVSVDLEEPPFMATSIDSGSFNITVP